MSEGFHRWPLTTKLRPPSRGIHHLPRPRLSEELANRGSYRLALVSAPAGSGKTTVLSEWYQALRGGDTRAAWLSLDGFDNDPRRFLAHLISAIRETRPDLGREARGFLMSNADALPGLVAASLVHDFERSETPLVVFMDDYQEIRDRDVHALMNYMLRYVPTGIRFAISSRKDPPLSIERIRIRGEVMDVRWQDLRFNFEETRNYLVEACRLPLSEDHVHTLHQRTEGWIAGIQLAAMALTGTEDVGRFVDRFTGDQRDVTDYLMESVFRRQTAAVRNFLEKTSILDRMTASLCDGITGRRDGQRMVERLESGNLFVFGLDDRRIWYRYHPLFADFLQNRLRAEHPEEIPSLHHRASVWFEQNGFLPEAVRHAIAGNRSSRALRLVERAGRDLFRQGDFQELRRWISAFPEPVVRRSPVLCLLHAWALAYQGELETARACMGHAEQARRSARSRGRRTPASRGRIQAEIRVIRAVLGIIQKDEPDVSGLDPDIVSRFPGDEKVLRSYASITLGFANRVEGNLSAALGHFRKALAESEAANTSLVNLNARLNIGIVAYLMGRMNEAEKSFRNSLEVARERMWQGSIGAAFLRYGLALVLHDRNRPVEALEELSEAISFLEARNAFGFLGMALVERARAHFARGSRDRAERDLAQAREVGRTHNVMRVLFRADLLEAHRAVLANKPVRAMACLEAAKASFDGKDFRDRTLLPERFEVYLVEHLRVLLARGLLEEAVKTARRGLRSAVEAGRGRHVVEFLVLEASARIRLSDLEKARERLERALHLAAGEGFFRPFLYSGEGILSLLRQLRHREKTAEEAASILSAVERCAVGGGGGRTSDRSGASLHPRELQILGLISEGLRNREIGERLFLSEETVKWYLKRLYEKLDVSTRTEAIASARMSGLLL